MNSKPLPQCMHGRFPLYPYFPLYSISHGEFFYSYPLSRPPLFLFLSSFFVFVSVVIVSLRWTRKAASPFFKWSSFFFFFFFLRFLRHSKRSFHYFFDVSAIFTGLIHSSCRYKLLEYCPCSAFFIGLLFLR